MRYLLIIGILTALALANPVAAHRGIVHAPATDDTLIGSYAVDEFYGHRGDDDLYGLGDADLLIGGRGDDYLQGMAGSDVLRGARGNDEIVSTEISGTADIVRCGRGFDRVMADDSDTVADSCEVVERVVLVMP